MQTTTPTTWEDVLRMPDDGNRYEFIDGRLHVTPAPSIRHHDVSHRLQSALRRILERTGHGRVFGAPAGRVPRHGRSRPARHLLRGPGAARNRG